MSRIAAVVALLLLAPMPAYAADPPSPPAGTPSADDMKRAKELFENGQILYDEGRYEDAITAWEQSYRLSGLADLLYNISGAYERLGNFRDALAALSRYRAFAPAAERETLDRRMRVLEERQKQAQATAKPPEPQRPPEEKVPPKTPPGRPVPVAPIALVVVGAGGLGLGAIEGIRAGNAVSSLKSQCVATDGGLLCPDGAKTASSVRKSAATTSAVALAGGGLLTAGGIVWLLVGGASGDVTVVPGPGSLALEAQF